MAKPNKKTDAITITNVLRVMMSISCGSYLTSITASPIRMASAISPAKMPIHMLRNRNGRRMKLQLAPTNFMV